MTVSTYSGVIAWICFVAMIVVSVRFPLYTDDAVKVPVEITHTEPTSMCYALGAMESTTDRSSLLSIPITPQFRGCAEVIAVARVYLGYVPAAIFEACPVPQFADKHRLFLRHSLVYLRHEVTKTARSLYADHGMRFAVLYIAVEQVLPMMLALAWCDLIFRRPILLGPRTSLHTYIPSWPMMTMIVLMTAVTGFPTSSVKNVNLALVIPMVCFPIVLKILRQAISARESSASATKVDTLVDDFANRNAALDALAREWKARENAHRQQPRVATIDEKSDDASSDHANNDNRDSDDASSDHANIDNRDSDDDVHGSGHPFAVRRVVGVAVSYVWFMYRTAVVIAAVSAVLGF